MLITMGDGRNKDGVDDSEEKVDFFHQLLNLDEDSLTYRIAHIQEQCSYPGLMLECREALKKLGLFHCDPLNYSKMAWKKLVTKTIERENKQQQAWHRPGMARVWLDYLIKVEYYVMNCYQIQAKSQLSPINIEQ